MHQHHRKVTLSLDGGNVVADPSIIGVESGDIVEFKSKVGEPDVTYKPPNAVKRDSKERVTVVQVPFEFYCALIVGTKRFGWKDGGIGLPDPPDLAGISPANAAKGSPDTVITVTGSSFFDVSKGLVNGQERFTQFVNSTSLRITVTQADLAQAGQLQIAVKNETSSNSLPLTVA